MNFSRYTKYATLDQTSELCALYIVAGCLQAQKFGINQRITFLEVQEMQKEILAGSRPLLSAFAPAAQANS